MLSVIGQTPIFIISYGLILLHIEAEIKADFVKMGGYFKKISRNKADKDIFI